MKSLKIIFAIATVLALSFTNLTWAAEDHKGHDHDAKKGAEQAHRVALVLWGPKKNFYLL